MPFFLSHYNIFVEELFSWQNALKCDPSGEPFGWLLWTSFFVTDTMVDKSLIVDTDLTECHLKITRLFLTFQTVNSKYMIGHQTKQK